MALELTINGTSYSFDRELTGAELLEELKVTPSTVVVELNHEIVRREDFLERCDLVRIHDVLIAPRV